MAWSAALETGHEINLLFIIFARSTAAIEIEGFDFWFLLCIGHANHLMYTLI